MLLKEYEAIYISLFKTRADTAQTNFHFNENVEEGLGLCYQGSKVFCIFSINAPLIPLKHLVLLPHRKAELFVVVLASFNPAPPSLIKCAPTGPLYKNPTYRRPLNFLRCANSSTNS